VNAPFLSLRGTCVCGATYEVKVTPRDIVAHNMKCLICRGLVILTEVKHK
jgi:hypothetical protein